MRNPIPTLSAEALIMCGLMIREDRQTNGTVNYAVLASVAREVAREFERLDAQSRGDKQTVLKVVSHES